MPSEPPERLITPPQLTEEDRAALTDLWHLYDRHYAHVTQVILQSFTHHPVLGPLMQSLPKEVQEQDQKRSYDQLKLALTEGQWLPYLESLTTQGTMYAQAGLDLPVWYEVVAVFKKVMVPLLVDGYHTDRERMISGLRGLTLLVDIAMPRIAQAFMDSVNARLERQALELRTLNAQMSRTNLDLARANAELEQVASAASHDLQAPLRAIDNLVGWLDGTSPMPAGMDQAQLFALVHNRVRRMRAMIDGLREYSRAGRAVHALELISLEQLFTEVVGLLDVKTGFQIRLNPPFPTVETVRVPLRHVVLNLVANALKHHDRQQGWVEIRARLEDENLILEVEDDGPGIEPRFAERIFKIFETLRPRDEVEASGVGLAIVKKWTEAVGGEVKLVPHDGRGATFRVVWPLKQNQGKPESGGLAVPQQPQGA